MRIHLMTLLLLVTVALFVLYLRITRAPEQA